MDGSREWVVAAAPAAGALHRRYAVTLARADEVREAFAAIDPQLRRRHERVPDPVRLARRLAAEDALAGAVGRVRAVAEGGCGLRSDAALPEAQRV